MAMGGAVRNELKIEQESDFDIDNSRRLFLDAQEAKKVSEHTAVR